MKTFLLAALLLLTLNRVADASTPVLGQSVIYRYDSTHSYPAIVTVADDGDGTQALVVLDTDGYLTGFQFGPNSQAAYATIVQVGIPEGSGDNRWRVNPSISRVTASSTPTLTLNGSGVQFDASHDVEYSATVSISGTTDIAAGFDGTVNLLCDAGATPSTFADAARHFLTGTIVADLVMTTGAYTTVRTRVPAGWFCRLTTVSTTGSPSFSIVGQVARTIGG